jgi:hypothetical protein
MGAQTFKKYQFFVWATKPDFARRLGEVRLFVTRDWDNLTAQIP